MKHLLSAPGVAAWIPAALALLLAGACADEAGKSDGTPDGGADADESSSVPGLSLAVETTVRTASLGGVQARAGNYYLTLEVTLANSADDETFATDPASFSVFTGTGLAIVSAAASLELSDGCRADVLLSPGTEVTCSVAFDVPLDDDAVAVQFESPAGLIGTADVAPATCTWCGNFCVDTLTDPANCGTCDEAIDADQACVDGERVCTNPAESVCGRTCANLADDPDHCGDCDVSLPSDQICDAGEAACADADETLCDEGCKDLSADDENCGACGQVCPSNGWCTDGGLGCYETPSLPDGETCDTVCADDGYDTCAGGSAFYDTFLMGQACQGEEVPIACDELAPEYEDSCYLDAAYCECHLTW